MRVSPRSGSGRDPQLRAPDVVGLAAGDRGARPENAGPVGGLDAEDRDDTGGRRRRTTGYQFDSPGRSSARFEFVWTPGRLPGDDVVMRFRGRAGARNRP